jgi:hypothetical protein
MEPPRTQILLEVRWRYCGWKAVLLTIKDVLVGISIEISMVNNG